MVITILQLVVTNGLSACSFRHTITWHGQLIVGDAIGLQALSLLVVDTSSQHYAWCPQALCVVRSRPTELVSSAICTNNKNTVLEYHVDYTIETLLLDMIHGGQLRGLQVLC